jgi:cysteine desulfurase/selenocysteine lyase
MSLTETITKANLTILKAKKLREDFPILNTTIRGKPLVYLDNAATSQRPSQVLAAYCLFCQSHNANVHRGIHSLGEQATDRYEAARHKVATFIGAPSNKTVVFTRGTTESINLVAYGYARKFLKPGDVIILTQMEHHANLVPWQLVANTMKVQLRFWPMTPEGTLDMTVASDLLKPPVKIVALTHVSNVLGTINPIGEIAEQAHAIGAKVLVDGAQAVPHMKVNVAEIGCDFYAFSAHKMCGPTGVGVLWGREELLEEMDPFMTGGEMIREVWLDHATWNELPYKFEPGTPPIAEAVSLGAAVEYLEHVGMDWIREHDRQLVNYAMNKLQAEDGVQVFGPQDGRGALVSFNVEGVHPHDLATLLDRDGIAVRAGHHCAQPLMRWLGVPATARASFYIYNLPEEIDQLMEGIRRAKKVFANAR